MKYVKENTQFTRIPSKYHQQFLYSPKLITSQSIVMGLTVDGSIDEYDFELIEFLYKVNFATEQQISRIAGAKGIENLKERLKALYKNSIINKFWLCDVKKANEKPPADALMVYCISDGGYVLLSNLVEEYTAWSFEKILKGSIGVSKQLIDTEIYLDTLFNAKIPISGYEKCPTFAISHQVFKTGSQFRFDANNEFYYMLVDCVHSDDDIFKLRKRLQNYQSLLGTNIWKRFYPDTKETPLILFVVENDIMALETGREVAAGTLLPDNGYRITTGERLLKGIDAPEVFLRYDKEQDTLYTTTIPIF